MVWPAAEPVRTSPPIFESSPSPSSPSPSASSSESLPLLASSFQQNQQYHRRQSTNRPPQHHNIPPTSPSPSPSQTTQDWHHLRQQHWLDRIPYDLPPQHPLLEQLSSQSASSSIPSTAPMPRGFVNMPGSYYSRSNSPSAEEQATFRLAHDLSSPPPSQQPTDSSSNHKNRILSPPPSSSSPIQDPFPTMPSAQPRPFMPHHSSSYERSPPPFTNISPSTQPATPLPSPPPSQHEQQQQQRHLHHRPTSPISLADSQPTLRQGIASRQDSETSSPMSPIPRPQVMSHTYIHSRSPGHGLARSGSGSASGRSTENENGNRRYPRSTPAEDTEAQALSAVVEGIGRMQVNMNLDQAGRWRIARRADAPW
ncbi:hypothetical protein CCMA1212_009348 [Trichoderma ghanense]|uniref:Uncharacterized protein n=1 Tax=Trichoderma ghanense TaxID=65468 RepID=A0ABY2GU13_9HYPO